LHSNIGKSLGKEIKMNASASYTNNQSFIMDEFNRVRMKARRNSLLARLIGRDDGLKYFPDNALAVRQNKFHAGIQNIPTEKIIGTVSRMDDFDKEFRPLKKHLRQRWVNMFILHESDGWGPIIVHKVGDGYFVEDGHHRVSVAKAKGMLFIEADVWDHVRRPAQPSASRSACRMPAKPVPACAAD
jgi:hypothetical protein